MQNHTTLNVLLMVSTLYVPPVKVGNAVTECSIVLLYFLSDEVFTVLSLEPNIYLKSEYEKTLGDFIKSGKVTVLNLAVSDEDGEGELSLASGINSLDERFLEVVFPENIVSSKLLVSVRRLSRILEEREIVSVGFLKIDAEGCDCRILRELFDSGKVRPVVVMFEAVEDFPERAMESLSVLTANGYTEFLAFIKYGDELLATSHFDGKSLPDIWRTYPGKHFYVNVVAQ